jgi:hypothetical protein
MDGYRRQKAEIEEREHADFVKVLDAIGSGSFWRVVKAELARDYHAIGDSFFHFEMQVDRDFKTQRKPRGRRR